MLPRIVRIRLAQEVSQLRKLLAFQLSDLNRHCSSPDAHTSTSPLAYVGIVLSGISSRLAVSGSVNFGQFFPFLELHDGLISWPGGLDLNHTTSSNLPTGT